jgi:hypothetical protein
MALKVQEQEPDFIQNAGYIFATSDFYFYMAVVLFNLGEFEGAIKNFNKAYLEKYSKKPILASNTLNPILDESETLDNLDVLLQ